MSPDYSGSLSTGHKERAYTNGKNELCHVRPVVSLAVVLWDTTLHYAGQTQCGQQKKPDLHSIIRDGVRKEWELGRGEQIVSV